MILKRTSTNRCYVIEDWQDNIKECGDLFLGSKPVFGPCPSCVLFSALQLNTSFEQTFYRSVAFTRHIGILQTPSKQFDNSKNNRQNKTINIGVLIDYPPICTKCTRHL